MSDWVWADLVDDVDTIRALIEPTSAYVQNAAMAGNRKIDELIVAAMEDDAVAEYEEVVRELKRQGAGENMCGVQERTLELRAEHVPTLLSLTHCALQIQSVISQATTDSAPTHSASMTTSESVRSEVCAASETKPTACAMKALSATSSLASNVTNSAGTVVYQVNRDPTRGNFGQGGMQMAGIGITIIIAVFTGILVGLFFKFVNKN